MQLRFFKILSVLLSVVTVCAAATTALHAAQSREDVLSHTTEITVKQSEIAAKGAFKAIQAALNAARYSATKDNVYKIIVEPGSYDLRSALHIYSNTILSLNNVTLVRNKQAIANMIRTGDDTAADKGETGYDYNCNISLEGGTLDGNGTSNTMVKVTHARGFKMTGTALCNLKNAHMMEIAGVDGFQVRSCTFRNQLLDVDGVGYEAIQLDIPKVGHIVGARSEALPMRNVHIEGCLFSNCPRGVGTHTQIMNLPFDGIVITNNTFTDIKSVAIQGENWKNVSITNNRIEKTPRAIALYSVLGGNGCGFKASVLAKEGKTSTDVSDSYQKPYKANIVVSGNVISDSGTVKDAYADYEPMAVSFIGKKLTKVGKTFSDGAGGYPKGDYYIDGVTVSGNTINAAGKGVYLENVRNARVKDNQIACTKSKLTKTVGNPLTSVTVTFSSIEGNTITASPDHGMELAESAITRIVSNTITGAPLDGIILEAESKVTEKIAGNTISKAGRYGINVRPRCVSGKVTDNIIYDCGKGGVRKEGSAVVDLGDNYFSITDIQSLSLNTQSVTLGTEESFALKVSYAPVNVLAQFTWASSDTKVVSVSETGVVTAHSFGEADVSVKSVNGKTASAHFKVMPAPKSVRLNANMLIIGEGETFDLDSRLPEGSVSHSITYTSNNEKAVSVQKNDGVVKGLAVGTATVVCKTYNGKHAACNVIVKAAPYDIWFDERELTLGQGETAHLNVLFPDGSAAHSLTWKSGNEGVAALRENGELTAVSPGTATVTATAYNGAKAVCYVTVANEPSEAYFAEGVYTLTAGETLQPEVRFAEGCASHALQFQSSDPDICRVNKTTGELTAKKPGVVTLTVKTYNRVFADCTVVVNPAEPDSQPEETTES